MSGTRSLISALTMVGATFFVSSAGFAESAPPVDEGPEAPPQLEEQTEDVAPAEEGGAPTEEMGAPTDERPPPAENPPEPAVSEAQALFLAGQSAFLDGRPADATMLFRRSLQLEPRCETAWNLALALRATNELVEAVATLDGIRDGRFCELTDELRSDVEAMRQELVRRVATLIITTAAEAQVEVEVDSNVIGVVSSETRLEHLTMPGEHQVIGRTGDLSTQRLTLEATAGETTEVVLSWDRRERPVWRRAWFWLIITATVATGVGLAIWLPLRERDDFYVDDVWGNIYALTRER